MINFTIQKEDLVYIFKALKSAVYKNDSKPLLQYIQFNCRDGRLTCYAVDGYRIHFVTVQIDVDGDNKTFSFLLKPFSVPKTSADCIICTLDETEITFDFWDRKYVEKLGEGEFIDCAEAFPKKEPIFKIAVDSKLMLKAFESLNLGLRERIVIMSFTDPLEPCVIKRVSDESDYRLVLPLRM